jgi:hypothetical protein
MFADLPRHYAGTFAAARPIREIVVGGLEGREFLIADGEVAEPARTGTRMTIIRTGGALSDSIASRTAT